MWDRLAVIVLRSSSSLMLIVGSSLLIAGVPTFQMSSEFPTVKTILGYYLEFGVVFSVAGGLALFLSRPRGYLLPNERDAIRDDVRPKLSGWLIVLAIFLVTWPIFIVAELQTFWAEWDRVMYLLVTSGVFEDLVSPLSGISLVPIAAALTPAAIEYGAVAAFTGASLVLLPLLLTRSPQFPRLYIVSIVVIAGFVAASVRGADGVMIAADAIQEHMRSSDANPDEIAQAEDVIRQHVVVVGSTSRILVWSFFGNLIWLPALLASQQARTTFAGRVSAPLYAAEVSNIEAITRPPRS